MSQMSQMCLRCFLDMWDTLKTIRVGGCSLSVPDVPDVFSKSLEKKKKRRIARWFSAFYVRHLGH
ncbi:MAG: hypothetical protein CLLPBCKN_002229 [Chroococcidiopsis cubana SAG 39.79]|nr:hypothetical protein [Chroococcidiopsis cubana SAG 39.79]